MTAGKREIGNWRMWKLIIIFNKNDCLTVHHNIVRMLDNFNFEELEIFSRFLNFFAYYSQRNEFQVLTFDNETAKVQ